jgi:hypothetical protein
MHHKKSHRYENPDRLADVIALIQVLAFDEDTHRSENGLRKELQGVPQSAPQWSVIAQQHPEFFRFREPTAEKEKQKPDGDRHRISLLARHVFPEASSAVALFPIEFVSKLVDAAIHLHDREISRGQRLKEVLLPLIVALIGAAGVVWAASFAVPSCK